MKKGCTITKISIFVITALIVFIASFSHVVNASQEIQNEDTSAVITENKTSKKGRKDKKDPSEKKAKYENLTDEEKQALKAKREAKKAEKKAKFENLTDEEKETLKAERKAKKAKKKEEKNNNVVDSQKAE